MPTISNFVVVPLLLTGLVTAALTYILVRVNRWINLTVMPRSDRWHTKPTPNSGGVGIFIACAGSYLLFAAGRHAIVAIGGAAIWLLGVIDDRLTLGPLPKLLSQAAIVIATVISSYPNPMTRWSFVAMLVTVVWILAVTNAFNLIDNMDGLCAGVAIIVAGTQAVMLATNGHLHDAQLFAIICGAFGGFLVFNYNPARIFMGDSGSMFAGFCLSTLSVTTPLPQHHLIARDIVYSLMLFAYPLFDAGLVAVVRRICGRPMSQGGRDHSSHRLVSLGIKERDATWYLWGLTVLGVVVGSLMFSVPLHAIGAVAVFALFVIMAAIFLATLPSYPLNLTPLLSRLKPRLPQLEAGVTLLVDSVAVSVALYFAYVVSYEEGVVAGSLKQLLAAISVAVLCHIATAIMSGRVLRVNWVYFGVADILSIIRVELTSAAVSYLILTKLLNIVIPLNVALVFAVLVIVLIVGIRSSLRVLRETITSRTPDGRRIAVFGTGDLTAATIALLRITRFAGGIPVMLVTDNQQHAKSIIGGVRVYTVRDGIERLKKEYEGSAILYPEGSGSVQTKEFVRQMCRIAKLEFLSVDLQLRHEELEPRPLTPVLRITSGHEATLSQAYLEGARATTPSPIHP
jgi:UDP-GlcNAc:undecaprenyl-phosphate/decaprenyl-phosphate GlcNAc-1-phosphate transferase